MTNSQSQGNPEGVAIIGMVGRFPGARNVEEFWSILCNGKETVSFFKDQELETYLIASASLSLQLDSASRIGAPNYVKARGLLEDAALFDAAFFSINPREAEVMDPQHRVFLECAWEALEDAGYDTETFTGSVGVFAGMSNNTYYLTNLASRRDLIETVGLRLFMLGNEKDYLTTRVAYKLNLHGPAINVYTACSTSLVAVSQAAQSLLNYQCDMALAGGVSITFPQKRGYLYQEGGIRSPDGHCRAFDARAQGTVFSDGVGVVVLKRLADALEDSDNILAIIKGFGTNNDGSAKVSFTAPSVDGQAEAIVMAQALAGFNPETITYVEAHGTGTELGDPIEVAALTQAFRAGTSAKGFCGIGSVKSNIGHLDAAAGIAGLIKTTLALKHKLLPASLHFEKPNPKIDFENSPFYVNHSLKEWSAGNTPRRAGVSSFGVGGTNAHVVLEEAPAIESSGKTRPWQVLLLSAKSPTALDHATRNLFEHFKKHPEANFADAAYTLQVGRRGFNHRRMLVTRDLKEAAELLESMDSKRLLTGSIRHAHPTVVFMFPGQGAQRVRMGLEVYRQESVFQEQVDRCAEILQPHLGLDLRRLLYPAADEMEKAEQRLAQTAITQPALFTVEYALTKLWMQWGVQPSAMIGHSVGEYVAACLAGVFSLEDTLRLVAERGRLMQALAPGSMLAVRLSEEELSSLLPDALSIAALNGAAMSVVSGPTEEVKAFEEQLTKQGVVCRTLNTSHAFHSAMMDPILEPFTRLVGQTTKNPPQIPIISNLSGQWISAKEATDPSYWARHLRQTVRFADGVSELVKDPSRILLEVGPGRTLSTLSRQHPGRDSSQCVVASLDPEPATNSEVASLLSALGKLWLAGFNVDWKGFYAQERRLHIPLPTYPFERKKYWIDPAPLGNTASAQKSVSPELIPQNAGPDFVPMATPPASSNNEVSMPETPASHLSAPNRVERILTQLKIILQEVSGVQASEMDASATFLEMGFDSLFLTQASQAFQNKLGVRVTFRQLLEDLTTLNDLAAFMDQKLPAEAFPTEAAPSVPTAVIESIPPLPMRPALEGDTTPSLIERVMQQQFQIMQQQLETLRAAGMKPTPAAQGGEIQQRQSSFAAISPPTPQDQATFERLKPPVVEESETPKRQPGGFGPYRPVDKGAGAKLAPQQQKYLDEFTERYTQRTAESKRLTQTYRACLADPRSVAGFRMQWKEMIYPIVSARSAGSRIWDVDGNEYVDLTMGFGVNLLGHLPPFVKQAIEEQLRMGIEIGPQSRHAGRIAELFCQLTGMERATFCNTGSEAVLAALRVARTVSARHQVVMFAGSYHGIFDEILARPLNVGGQLKSAPIAPGIPSSMVENMLVLDYGAPQSLEIIQNRAHELAAVLVEPVQSRHPDLQPKEFLQELRRITEQRGTALIFDEMVTGFRIHPGGVQALFGIQADLATYGKVIAGGLPVGVLAGRAKFMDALDGGMWQFGDDSLPEVGVTFFAGTFIRHPLTLAAVWAVLNHLKAEGPQLQEQLNRKADYLVGSLNGLLEQFHVPLHIPHFGSIFTLNFPQEPRFSALLSFHMRMRGINISEGRQCFLSVAHSEEDIELIIRAFKESLQDLYQAGFLPPSAPQPPTDQEKGTHPEKQETFTSESSPERAPRAAKFANEISAGTPGGSVSIPLGDAQKEVWLATQMGDEASSAFNESLTLKLQGPLDLAALKTAIQALIDRHEALRLTFSPLGEYQSIASTLNVEVPLIDLTGLSKDEQDRRLKEISATESGQPFDLIRGPLLRFKLVKTATQCHSLILTAHHIICDGWSFGVLLSDLSVLYSAHHEKKPAALKPPMQISDFVKWEEEPSQSSASTEAEAYWIRQFKDAAPVLELPIDHRRPIPRTYGSTRQSLTVRDSLFQSLKKLGTQSGSTLFTVLLAAYKIFLHRLSQQDELVVGMFAAGQSMIGHRDLVGHYVNMLPLRSKISSEQPFQNFLADVKRVLLDAMEHNQCTFGRLVQKLNLPRDPSRLPLVSVTFNLDKKSTGLNFAGLAVETVSNPKQFTNFDIFLNGVESENEVTLDFTYNTDLLDEATMTRWLSHFQTLIQGIVAHPQARIAELPMISESTRHQVVESWNQTTATYPRDQHLHQILEAQVEKTPDAIAVVFEDRALTYRELNARANQLAHYLRKLGAKPDTLIGLCVERSLDMVVGLLGILKAGAAYVPLDPNFPKDRLAYMLADSGASVLLTQQRLIEYLPQNLPVRFCLDTDWKKVAREKKGNPIPIGSSEDLAYVIYTSGSTGKPKGVQIEHRSVANFLESMRREPGISESDVLLAVTTLSFDIAGLELYLPLISGARLIIANREEAADGTELAKLMVSSGATVMQATPATWRLLLDSGWTGRSNLKILCGGEALPLALAQQLLPKCTALWNLYGPTETTIWSTLCQVKPEDSVIFIGRPIANTQIYILDEQKQPVPIGVTGKLYIGGDGLARGYLNRPELTAEKFIPNPFSKDPKARLYDTGDLARYRVDGRLECLGRMDHQVKLRGFRIELGEIETVLAQHPGVKQAVAMVREDTPGDSRLVAYLIPSSGASSLSFSELRQFLRAQLPDYMLPATFVLLEAFPLTPNGKIDRRALPEPEGARPDLQEAYVSPRTPLEEVIAGIWAEVLGVERVGVRDNFFDLGGHSLRATRVVSRLRDTLQMEVPLRRMFETPTVLGLAETMAQTPAVRAEVEKRAQLLVNLAHLSDDEAATLLDEKPIEVKGESRP